MSTENATPATPATPSKKTRKGRKPANKVPYRVPNGPKLIVWPDDWDSAKHQPLSEDDFEDQCQFVYWDHRVEELTKRVDHAKSMANLCRRYGGKEQRDKAAKVERLQSQLAALMAELGQ